MRQYLYGDTVAVLVTVWSLGSGRLWGPNLRRTENDSHSRALIFFAQTEEDKEKHLPVSTPLTLQLGLQQDSLQLPLQGGGDAVLRPRQTLPAAHGGDELLQLHPRA